MNFQPLLSKLISGKSILLYFVSTTILLLTGNSMTYSQCEAGKDKIVCSENAQLNAELSTLYTGSWSTTGSAQIENPTLYNTFISNLDAGENIFVWQSSLAECLSIQSQLIVTNNSVVATAGTSRFACLHDSVILNGNQPENTIGWWSKVANEDGSFGAGNIKDISLYNTSVTDLSTDESQSIKLQWNLSKGICESTSNIITIINRSITQAIAGEDLIICENTLQLNANIANIGTGLWSISIGNGDITNEAQYNTTIKNIKHGINYFKWTISNENCKNADSIMITNNTVNVNQIEDFVACYDTTNLSVTPAEDGSGSWQILSGEGSISDISSPTPIISLSYGENKLKWTVSKNKCTGNTEFTITNNSFDYSISEIINPTCNNCNGSATINSINGQEPYSLKWNDAANQTQTKTENLCPDEYIVTISDNLQSCFYNEPIVLINEGQLVDNIEITGNQEVIENEQNVLYSTATIADNYIWSISGGSIKENNDNNITIDWDGNGVGIIDLTLENICGQTIADAYQIKIKAPTEIPPNQNILTPNGDGFDDVFIVNELGENLNSFPNNELSIYTKWGVLVYQTAPYINLWNGEANTGSLDGKELPNGTYYYILNYDKNKKSTKSGYIVIIK